MRFVTIENCEHNRNWHLKSLVSRIWSDILRKIWIHVMNVDIAHLFGFMHFLPNFTLNGLKMQKTRKITIFQQKSRFWPTWRRDRALGHKSKKMRKVHFSGDWVASNSQNSQLFSRNFGFSVNFWFFAKKWCKNFLHKKLKKNKNMYLGEFYIFCFINFFVSPSTKMWHPKNW